MKKLFLLILFLLFASQNLYADGFVLHSKDIHGQLSLKQVYSGFGCKGENISPELEWKNSPAGTKSFAVTVYDPDAPTGSGWWHWLVFDIPANVHRIASGAADLPAGSIQSMTDFGKSGYGGACPPEGDRPHRYVFTVYALDTPSLGLNKDARPALVGFVINKHTLAKASLIAYYGR